MQAEQQSDTTNDLVDILRGIVLVLDSKGCITRCNPFFENLTGYNSAEIIGKNWFGTFIPEESRHNIREFFQVVMKEGLDDGYTNEILTKSEERRTIEWHSKTLEGPEGSITGMLCTGFDVTERLRVTAELEKEKANAINATETKTRFLAAASHDLRQPLQSLGLYLSVLSRLQDQSKLDEVVSKMRLSVGTMGDLLDALLDISRLDGGSVTAEKRDIHLQELFQSIVFDNIQHAEEVGLLLECTEEDCVIHSDPALLVRVIENYVTNAIRYTEKGRVRIDFVRDGASVTITVSDTGIGIPEQQIQSVFEEYYQLDNNVRDRRKGLGLGLSIVKHISRILEHPVNVSSVVGEGSVFSVEVPLGRQVERVEEEKVQKIKVAEREPVVLFVDDDSAIVDATTMLLELAGLNVCSALSGEEALRHIESGVRPDILVSDYRLPGYNGIEVVRRVRAAFNDEVPAVLMTGDTSAKDIDNAGLKNCTVFRKPVDTDQLISHINQLVN